MRMLQGAMAMAVTAVMACAGVGLVGCSPFSGTAAENEADASTNNIIEGGADGVRPHSTNDADW